MGEHADDDFALLSEQAERDRATHWARSLNQTAYWRTGVGETIKLDEMTPKHRKNVLAYLRSHAPVIHFLCTVSLPSYRTNVPIPGRTPERDAVEWIRTTPLWQALIAAHLAHLDIPTSLRGDSAFDRREATEHGA